MQRIAVGGVAVGHRQLEDRLDDQIDIKIARGCPALPPMSKPFQEGQQLQEHRALAPQTCRLPDTRTPRDHNEQDPHQVAPPGGHVLGGQEDQHTFSGGITAGQRASDRSSSIDSATKPLEKAPRAGLDLPNTITADRYAWSRMRRSIAAKYSVQEIGAQNRPTRPHRAGPSPS